jgi:hypothetical protein
VEEVERNVQAEQWMTMVAHELDNWSR